MSKFAVTVQEINQWTFLIEADSADEAAKLAIDNSTEQDAAENFYNVSVSDCDNGIQ